MRFTTTVAGKISAIRFYKRAKETELHIGKIYSSTGVLLAQVKFTNETAGAGWQKKDLATPLAIAANTEYTVAVTTGNMIYVATSNAMGAQIANANIPSIAGNNGVFGPVGAIPKQSWNNSNYFRDIVLMPNM